MKSAWKTRSPSSCRSDWRRGPRTRRSGTSSGGHMRSDVRYSVSGLIALAGLVLLASAATSARAFPDLIQLPADFGPEGIAVGNGTTFYAGSLAAATRGQILVGDLRTGEFATLVPPDGIPATGMKHDPRSDLLFVARANSGMATILD